MGAEFEDRLAKGSKTGKMGFADLVWRSRLGVMGVVIEMKSRGEDLSKHYAQVERYWMRIAPDRPRYAMLCNFDEFWIFDFENQVDEPVDRIPLVKLPERAGAFSFMEIGGQKPVFNNNQVIVTERTARRMGEFYQQVYQRGQKSGFQDFSPEQLQKFMLQCVMAMFAEDRGLLPRDLFVALVQDCKDRKASTYDLLGGLFREMNQPGTTKAGRYQGVDYFNGGLFSEIYPIELTGSDLRFWISAPEMTGATSARRFLATFLRAQLIKASAMQREFITRARWIFARSCGLQSATIGRSGLAQPTLLQN